MSYVDHNFQPESLQTWGKRGSLIMLRCGVIESLFLGVWSRMGTPLSMDASDDESGAVIESVKAASEELYTAECEA
ncbi:hypothetical protein [Nostoc sp. FACHB-888]|uniref:hypothetical protein n=1 Tax=Nostoc sp. FACHB-888 TaxID=2692842 RepID=UPI001F54EDCC|nr:hypothetical protein [Nostoc sp. FACHB-888]